MADTSAPSAPFDPRYRPCVGIMVLNDQGLVFVGQRAGAEASDYAWQMPQGGIDEGETPEQAAWRELAEETSITTAELLGESEAWLAYDLPVEALQRWPGKYIGQYKGQAQKWFVFRFRGDDSDIDLTAHDEVEFSDWRWQRMDDLANLVVPFKKAVYEAIVAEFRHYP